MAIKGRSTSQSGKALIPGPRSLSIAAQGLNTVNDFVRFHSAVILDLMTGAITPRQANAVSREVGKLLNATSTAISLEKRLRRLMAS